MVNPEQKQIPVIKITGDICGKKIKLNRNYESNIHIRILLC